MDEHPTSRSQKMDMTMGSAPPNAPQLEYVTSGGYQYAMTDGRVVRVPRERPSVTRDPPKVGDSVTVIVKPYNNRNYVSGIVKRVLTKKKQHTRGFKVMLTTGVVGRMVV